MAVINIGKANFADVVNNNSIVLIDIWASWSEPCEIFAKTFETVSDEYSDVIFARLNMEEEREIADYLKVEAIPLLLAMRDQTTVFLESGTLQKDELERLIEKIRLLDMEEVRKEIAEEIGDEM